MVSFLRPSQPSDTLPSRRIKELNTKIFAVDVLYSNTLYTPESLFSVILTKLQYYNDWITRGIDEASVGFRPDINNPTKTPHTTFSFQTLTS